MKVCSKCKQEKELSEFYKHKINKKYGVGGYCKECQKLDKKKDYQNNRERYIKNAFNTTRWLIDLKKGLKCSKCGFSHPAALDFHHTNPNEKDFQISGRINIKHKEKILNEIKKCIILCANCHRIEHAVHVNEYINQ